MSNPLQFLALGDSYTIGEAVNLEQGWPAQLVELLRSDGWSVADTQIIAQTGWTTGDLITALIAAVAEHASAGTCDIVFLLCGVNNQYQGLPIDQYESEFQKLIELALERVGGEAKKVVVLSIPDWGVTPFAKEKAGETLKQIASEIDAFNRINCRLAYKAGCTYVDVTSITRIHKADVHAWAEDGLHPAELMYTQWARKLQPVMHALPGLAP